MQLQAAAATKGCTKFNEKVFSLPLFLSLHMKMLPIACESVRVCVCVCCQSKQFKLETVTHTHTQLKLSKQRRKHVAQIFSAGAEQLALCVCVWTLVGQLQPAGSEGNRQQDRQLDMGHGNNCTCHMAQQMASGGGEGICETKCIKITCAKTSEKLVTNAVDNNSSSSNIDRKIHLQKFLP